MLDEFCPDCGKHRVALFRYCLACGLDFDELDARGELPGGPYSPIAMGMASTGGSRPATGPDRVRSRAGATAHRLSRYLPVGIAAVLAVAVVGALAIGVGNGAISTAVRGSASPSAAAAAAAVPAALTPTPTPTADPVLAPTGPTVQAIVTSVVDGDTIIVAVGDAEYRVRYLGIDAPESVSLDRPVEYLGRDAADANRRLVSSATVVLERDQSETDDHGQLLRHVWVERGGTLVLVGLELVREGLARVDANETDLKYRALFEDAEHGARIAAGGVWGDHPLPVTGPTPPPVASTLPRLVGADPITVYSSTPTHLGGNAGTYFWPSMGFSDPEVDVLWDVRASVARACSFDWRLEPSGAEGAGAAFDVRAAGLEAGRSTHAIAFDDAVLTVTTTCPTWSLSLQGAPTP